MPDTLFAHEQKIDHDAPVAKRRHHFRGFTKKEIPPPHTPPLYLPCIFRKFLARVIPCVKMETKIKTKIKVKWNEMELNEMEWN